MAAQPTATDARRRARHRRKRGWSEAHVRRLFWRAGFGATPREARHWARRGKKATLHWVLNGGPSPAPRMHPPRIDGHGLRPRDEWGHDVLWWLDRMVRSRRPLQEKLTLFWHDHFATSDQDTPLMLAQNQTLRRHALGSFPALLRAVTSDSAMLLFLSLADSDKEAPNENYARELMELFTLGRGYTERDIRQAARALTGFRVDWDENGPPRCYYEKEAHDSGAKRIFGHHGHYDWQDVLRLCVGHPAHAPFLVGKLWDYFVGTPISGGTRRRLAQRLPPLRPPDQAGGGRDPRPPRALPEARRAGNGQVAGGLRRRRAPEHRPGHRPRQLALAARATWASTRSSPPSVAGWDWGVAWLSSNSMRVRFDVANYLARHAAPAREGRLHAREAVAPRSRRARPPGRRRPLDLGAHRGRARAHGPPPAHRAQAEGRRLAPGQAGARRHVPAGAPPAAPLRPRRPRSLMPRHNACDDFHRTSEAVRRDLLGDAPLTRRQVLAGGLGAGLALYTAQALPVTRVLEAAAADAAAAPNAPVLVSVFLPGGVDLLDTLVPLHDYGRYADLHKELKVEGTALAGGSGLGLHPSLSRGVGGGVKGLFERGKIGFLPGIDYPDPDLSHFHSRHFWETGLITERSAPGWLGRWLDRAGNSDNPLQGISMGYGLSPVAALGARAGGGRGLAGRCRVLDPRRVGRALRRGDEEHTSGSGHGPAGSRATQGGARRRAAREGRGRPARALRGARRPRPARLLDPLPRRERLRAAGCATSRR